MSDEANTNRLGRGLSALLGDTEFDQPEPTSTGQVRVPVEFLRPNPNQPRKRFSDENLEELAQSIREKGILQPIVVRPIAGEPNSYEIVAGERRWRAAQKASMHDVPVSIRELSDSESLEIALIENIQRADLNPIEEAAGFKALMDRFDYTQEQLSEIVGKSRSHVANLLRLLSLPAELQSLVENGSLSAGHGRALLSSSDPANLAKQIIKEDLNVRQTEALAKGRPSQQTKTPFSGSQPIEKDADTLALEQNLSNSLGLKVSIDHGQNGGLVVVKYKTLEQLDEICRRLGAA